MGMGGYGGFGGGGPGGFGGGRGGGGGRMHFSDDKKVAINWKLLPRIGTFYKPYIATMALMLLTILIQAGLGLIPPQLTRLMIDKAILGGDMRLLVLLFFGTLGFSVVSGLFGVAESYLNSWVGTRIVRDLRNKLFTHLQQLPLTFYNASRTGDIISRMNNDVNGIQGVITSTVTNVISNVVNIIAVLTIMISTNWRLTVLGVIVIPLFIVPTRLVGRVRWRIARATQEKFAEMSVFIHEHLGISGVILSKIFVRQDEHSHEYRQISGKVAELQLKESLAGRWFGMVMRVFGEIGPQLIYLYGGYLVIKGELTVGAIIAFNAYQQRLTKPVTQLSNLHVDISRSMALVERLFEYMDTDPECPGNENLPDLPPVSGAIEFRDVFFRYSEDGPAVLSGVSFKAEPGQLVALVGPSGAGKTTITTLVPRLYNVDSGSVLIDGTDITKVSLSSLRRQIGMVTQDIFLFNDTVRANLLYAKPNASEDEIVAAAKAAYIHDLITSLPQGYDTIVGERGIKLSGGEKQRIAIARIVLNNPRIFILDEATSSLDSRAEYYVQQALSPLLVGRTSLVIAHRLSTILAADQILVVEDGRIVESGTHAELLANDSLYATLYQQQFLRHGGLRQNNADEPA